MTKYLNRKNFAHLLQYSAIRIAVLFARITDSRNIAIEMCYFFLFSCLSYRKDIVGQQLKYCFPHMDNKEVETVVKRFYRHLATVVFDTLSAKPPSDFTLRFQNPEILRQACEVHPNVLVLCGHLGNWETGFQLLNQLFPAKIKGLYKPLSNPFVNRFLFKRRMRNGQQLLKVSEWLRSLSKPGESSITWHLADQYPGSKKRSLPIQFFGKDSFFDTTVCQLARRFNIPVYYLWVRELEADCYSLEVREISKNPSMSSLHDVVAKYAQYLEENIRQDVGIWLWSHKRWK